MFLSAVWLGTGFSPSGPPANQSRWFPLLSGSVAAPSGNAGRGEEPYKGSELLRHYSNGCFRDPALCRALRRGQGSARQSPAPPQKRIWGKKQSPERGASTAGGEAGGGKSKVRKKRFFSQVRDSRSWRRRALPRRSPLLERGTGRERSLRSDHQRRPGATRRGGAGKNSRKSSSPIFRRSPASCISAALVG